MPRRFAGSRSGSAAREPASRTHRNAAAHGRAHRRRTSRRRIESQRLRSTRRIEAMHVLTGAMQFGSASRATLDRAGELRPPRIAGLRLAPSSKPHPRRSLMSSSSAARTPCSSRRSRCSRRQAAASASPDATARSRCVAAGTVYVVSDAAESRAARGSPSRRRWASLAGRAAGRVLTSRRRRPARRPADARARRLRDRQRALRGATGRAPSTSRRRSSASCSPVAFVGPVGGVRDRGRRPRS